MSDLKLEDIAKLAGVSRSTVSRVVNASPNVSLAARKRVEKIIQNTGYHPNAAARSLASQRTHMIGLVIPRTTSAFFTDPYFPQLTQGVAFACNDHHLTLSLFLVGNQNDEDEITPRISRRGMLDGILIQSGTSDDRLLKRLQSSQVPCLVMGRPLVDEAVNYIDVDNIRAAKQATKHLIGLGYQRIGMITGSKNSSASIDRSEGFRQAMQESEREVEAALIFEGDFSENSGYIAMEKLLPSKPDAIFAQSDIMAIGAMRAVQEVGLKVPQDIAFVGFDDLPIASVSAIKLTTIRQPITHFGIKAVELLIDIIEKGAKPAKRLILDTELVIRESCGAKLRDPLSPQVTENAESALKMTAG
ncbi:MAG: LacI family DNA-binding transcriptional regulator [Anaerolineaceae bacterium]